MLNIRKEDFTVGGIAGHFELLDVGGDIGDVAAEIEDRFLEPDERVIEFVDLATHVDPVWAVWQMTEDFMQLQWMLCTHSPGVLVRHKPDKVTDRCLEVLFINVDRALGPRVRALVKRARAGLTVKLSRSRPALPGCRPA